jgi:hypothetical protein
MSKMAELAYDIEQLYIEGYGPKSIALQLECPIEIVYDWIESHGCMVDAPETMDPYATINS